MADVLESHADSALHVRSAPVCDGLFLAVSEKPLRASLRRAATRAGLHVVPDRDDARHVVSDQLVDAQTVLVTRPSPLACRMALDVLRRGRVSAVICSDEPGQLPAAIGQAADGWTLATTRVVALANDAPPMSSRQEEVLLALLKGLDNDDIAGLLHLSLATVKREVSALLRSFAVTNRLSLAMQCARLGIV